ncbi:ArsC family (seleno)protein [Zavarzinella formosa]|uniref:ArsC family (seleno)protein n=1 Tax=Zavarzinella formosa TaxID=360055 RepID=UPI0002D78E12|nr:ArsC family (seleno)protein [Zavarzinella formosa]
MAKKIDWMYDRKSCVTCKKARGYMESVGGVTVSEKKEASKERISPEEALKLARTADRVVAMKGQKVVEFDLKKNPPSDEELLAVLIGPTGNLRAPTAFVGKTMMVGFHEETYKTILGL